MTHNQIDFARLKEERRHNIVGEKETGRHNLAQEAIGSTSAAAAMSQAAASHRTASELARHNVQTENINWYTAENLAGLQAAQAYSNIQTGKKVGSEVGIQAGQLEETRRHNVASEAIEQEKAEAATRSSKAQVSKAITGGLRDVAAGAKDIIGTAGGVMGLLGKIGG